MALTSVTCALLLTLPLVILWSAPASSVTSPAARDSLLYLRRTLRALGKALNFFHDEHRHVNLDAVIGTRIVQATFKVLTSNLDASGVTSHIPVDVSGALRLLEQLARQVSDKSTPYVVASEPNYFKHIGPIIQEGLFSLDYPSRDLPRDVMIWEKPPREVMGEEESDACLAELFRTRFGYACSISHNCWKQMTSQGYSLYSLTHQIFYLEIAQQLPCGKELWRHLSLHDQTLDGLQDTFCANILAESRDFAAKKFPVWSQDLFMEQAALCGMLGYREFFTSDWLDNILSWQDKNNGCYRWSGWPMKEHEPHESTRLIKKVIASIRPNPVLPQGSVVLRHRTKREKRLQPLHRGKREEKRVAHGCLCHKTTVAASALAQYARYVLEDWLAVRSGDKSTFWSEELSPNSTSPSSRPGQRAIEST